MQYRMLFVEELETVQVGDEVIRVMAGIPMTLRVTDVTETSIFCGGWEFSKEDGRELDDLMSSPPSYLCALADKPCTQGGAE
jgi:hypothetical protein